jgi:hypothetical protein
MTKEIQIRLKNGNKETEITFPILDNVTPYIVLEGAFKFLDIDVDFGKTAEKHLRIQQMYSDFYATQPLPSATETNENVSLAPIPEELIVAPQEEILKKVTPFSEKTENEWFNIGIKIRNGKKNYRVRYECTKCKHVGNHYATNTSFPISCHECRNKMNLSHSLKTSTIPTADEDFNYFVAGLKQPM